MAKKQTAQARSNSEFTPPKPETSSGPTAEKLEGARAIDEALKEDEGGTGARSIANGEEPPKKRGRPRGSKNAEPEPPKPPDPFIVGLVNSIVPQIVTLAKRGAGWNSPEIKIENTVIMSEADWCKQVAECNVAVLNKYFPDASAYAPEIALIVLVVPWMAENLIQSMIKARKAKQMKQAGAGQTEGARANAERKSNGDTRNDGNGENNETARANAAGAAASIPS